MTPTGTALGQRACRLAHSRQAAGLQRARRRVRTEAISVRPYTVRKGDSLSSIAQKREVDVDKLKKLNHEIDLEQLQEGQTIVLPAGKLSARDKEIIAGIGRSYRTYPVREGESIQDIIEKRQISMAEVEALNPETKLNALKGNQLIKLPSNKYTTREREMLSGTAGAPEAFFMPGNPFSNSLLIALGLGVAFSAWLFQHREADDEEEEAA